MPGATIVNREDRQCLVVENLPLVGYMVADLCAKARHLPREDLAERGVGALAASSRMFDPGSGVPFGVFARGRILGAVVDDLCAEAWPTRPARMRTTTTLELQGTLAWALGRRPTVTEIASTLGVDRARPEAGLAQESRAERRAGTPTNH